MTIIRIKIEDSGAHWHKRIWLFGIPVYHRHDYTKGEANRTVGFNAMPYNPIDVDDEYEEG